MDHISSVLGKVVAKRGLKKHIRASQVICTASRFVLEQFPGSQEEIYVQKFAHGTLEITCAHAIYAQELFAYQIELLQKLQDQGYSDVSEIRILRA